jgi:hypothetical protein
MTEKQWFAARSPHKLVKHLGIQHQQGRKIVLLGIACCRLFNDLLISPQTQKALELLESSVECPADVRQRRFAERQAIRGYRWAILVADRYELPARAVRILTQERFSPPAHVLNDLDLAAAREGTRDTSNSEMAALLRDIFGNPFRPYAFDPAWRTSTAVALAQQMYDSRDFGLMPILGDALQDAGCENADILDHCRGDGPHVRGCWVVDLVLGKE